MDNKKIKNTVTDSIADTLYIPLAMKNKETKRKHAFFQDPYACEIIQKIDYDFSKYDKAIRSSVGVAIRARYFDQLTKDFIEKNNNVVVVHLGCGLDTRFQRLGKHVTDKAVFYDLDLPEVIAIRKKLLSESENNFYIPASMFETQWMDKLSTKHLGARFLFVIEGVWMYFETDEVKKIVQNLAQRFRNSQLVFDVLSSWVCKNSSRHDTVKYTQATFKFGCDDSYSIEKWGDNLRLKSEKLYCDFKDWKKAGVINCTVMKLIPKIRKSCRMLVYSIN